MSDINGASATSSRWGAWDNGWDSVAAPPEGRSLIISCAVVEIIATSLVSSSLSSYVVGDVVLVMNARLDAAANEARGVDGGDDGEDADVDDG